MLEAGLSGEVPPPEEQVRCGNNMCRYKSYPAEHLKFLQDGLVLLSKDGLQLQTSKIIVSDGDGLK